MRTAIPLRWFVPSSTSASFSKPQIFRTIRGPVVWTGRRFARISGVRSEEMPKPCSHGRRQSRAYDEQRERGKRSFPSLLIRAERKMPCLHGHLTNAATARRQSSMRESAESEAKPCSHGRRQSRASDEQRERGKRSFPSLVIRAERKMPCLHGHLTKVIFI